jgi:hypothetical protein
MHKPLFCKDLQYVPQKLADKGFTFLLGITLLSLTMVIVMFCNKQQAVGDTRGHKALPMIVTPVLLRSGMEAICLIDQENKTLAMYQYILTKPMQERLVLLAARSYKYDLMLDNFNTAEPHPDEVKTIIENAMMFEQAQEARPSMDRIIDLNDKQAQKQLLSKEAALDMQSE